MPNCTQSWNNNIPPGAGPGPGGGPGHVQNSYALGHGQPSPLPPGPGGPGGPGGQAPVPSPLYPWMRSQFGKLVMSCQVSSVMCVMSELRSPLTLSVV